MCDGTLMYKQTQMRALPLCLTGRPWMSCECLRVSLYLVLRLISNLECLHAHPIDTHRYYNVYGTHRTLLQCVMSLSKRTPFWPGQAIPTWATQTNLNVKEKWLISLPSISLPPSLSLPCSCCLSVWPPEGQPARGQSSWLFLSVSLQLSVHPVRWDSGSLTDIYLDEYGGRFQTEKWLLSTYSSVWVWEEFALWWWIE